MTEERLNNWRNTMKIIVDCKNGKLPEEAQEDRLPAYNCRPINFGKMVKAQKRVTPSHMDRVEGQHKRIQSVLKGIGTTLLQNSPAHKRT